jgi:hypothetical protein
MPPKEVFLSHSSQDREITQRIAVTLRNHGIPVWYSATNIRGAQQWQDEIGRALKRCDFFIVLLSNQSIASEWVKRELSYALSHGQYTENILPISLEQCDFESLSWTLGAFEMVDLAGDYTEGCRNILNTWGFGLELERLR